MSRYPAHPQRLVDLSSDKDLVGVSALVRAAAVSPRGLQPAARQRIRGRLRRALARPAPAIHGRWRLALVVIVTLGIGGVVGAATHSVIMRRWSPTKTAEPALANGRSGKHRILGSSTLANPAALDVPAQPDIRATPSPEPLSAVRSTVQMRDVAPEPALSPRPPAAPQPSTPLRGSPSRSPRVALPSSPATSAPIIAGWSPGQAQKLPPTGGASPSTEAAVLAQAIRSLRVDGDAAAALRLLDERQAGFSDGTLKHEASAVRVEALLRLGRADAALADLDRLPLAAVPRGNEWHVIRGELRARSGRWSDAEADFAAALARGLLDVGEDLAERALWGRALARSHQGNLAGSHSDALEYLRRFPSGRFAEPARQALPR